MTTLSDLELLTANPTRDEHVREVLKLYSRIRDMTAEALDGYHGVSCPKPMARPEGARPGQHPHGAQVHGSAGSHSFPRTRR